MEGHGASRKDVVSSPPFLSQTYHTVKFDCADKENFERSLSFKALERLKGLYAKEVPSHLASYMEGKFSGV